MKTPPLVLGTLREPSLTSSFIRWHASPCVPGGCPNAMSQAVSWDGKMPSLLLMVTSSYKALQCLLEQSLEHKGLSSEPNALTKWRLSWLVACFSLCGNYINSSRRKWGKFTPEPRTKMVMQLSQKAVSPGAGPPLHLIWSQVWCHQAPLVSPCCAPGGLRGEVQKVPSAFKGEGGDLKCSCNISKCLLYS